jgi:hypothetical protein
VTVAQRGRAPEHNCDLEPLPASFGHDTYHGYHRFRSCAPIRRSEDCFVLRSAVMYCTLIRCSAKSQNLTLLHLIAGEVVNSIKRNITPPLG